jgi:hypothetical protein
MSAWGEMQTSEHVRFTPKADIDPQPYPPSTHSKLPRFCLEFSLIGMEAETEIKSNIGRADMTPLNGRASYLAHATRMTGLPEAYAFPN